jgi:hypothetical protein
VLSASAYDDTIAWYENGGQSSNPTFTKRVITNTADYALSVHARDLDGDGDIDVLSASLNDDTIAWYENGGQRSNPTFTKRVITNTADGVFFVNTADIDGDGNIDVLSASLNDDTVAWYENGGQSRNFSFTKRVITNTANGALNVYAADIDGDGDMDVLSASKDDDIVAWYQNGRQSSNFSFTKRVITNTANGAHFIYTADIDGDGDLDVLSASFLDNTVAWYENGGQSSIPTFTKRVITNTAPNVVTVYAADIDCDGDMDALSASIDDNTIAWYQNYRLSYINCPRGKYYAVINGSSSCMNCSIGSYQDETGKSSCKSCPMGSYQNQTGQIICNLCPGYYYQDKVGQSFCIACPNGTYNIKEGQTSQSSCLVNITDIYFNLNSVISNRISDITSEMTVIKTQNSELLDEMSRLKVITQKLSATLIKLRKRNKPKNMDL